MDGYVAAGVVCDSWLSVRVLGMAVDSGLGGPAGLRVVQFDFDLESDTAFDVASEMVEDLQLSPKDAAAIAAAIKDEVSLLTGKADAEPDGCRSPFEEPAPKWILPMDLPPEALLPCSDSVSSVGLDSVPKRGLGLVSGEALGMERGVVPEGTPPSSPMRSIEGSFRSSAVGSPMSGVSGPALDVGPGLSDCLERSDSAYLPEGPSGSLSRKRSCSGRLTPSKMEDLNLPLKKLMENLQVSSIQFCCKAGTGKVWVVRF